MQKYHNKSILKPIILTAATLSIIICIAILRYNLVEKKIILHHILQIYQRVCT